MTDFEIEQYDFSPSEIQVLELMEGKYVNWPVVYTLSDDSSVYVGRPLSSHHG